MDNFALSLGVSALAALLCVFAFSTSASPLLFLFYVALSQAGFFALAAFRKAGLPSPRAGHLFLAAAFVCFLAAALAFGSNVRGIITFAPLPIMLCVPAALSLVAPHLS